MKHSFLDKYSNLNSPLHRIDPRGKLITFILSIGIIVSEPREEIKGIFFYYLIIVILLSLSRIPLKYILKRCLLVSPIIIMAAAFLPLSYIPGWKDLSEGMRGQVFSFSLSLILKVFAAVILLTLLTSTEKFNRLLDGLRKLKMPSVLGMISALMYRYVFILNDEILRIKLARESRTPGKIRISRFKIFGNQAAMIFIRSWSRAQIVYNTMLSRGFNGDFHDFKDLSFTMNDALFVIIILSAMVLIRVFL
ncbi:MAG: cobalt ECF transporter T component CbiQ [Candidatus Aminicenantaceae bacterium]